MRRTKIVATVGPASESPEVLDELIRAGLDVVRLNLSHGTVEEHLRRLADVRAASARIGRQVAVLADLPGPKVRSGRFPDGGSLLVEGALVDLVPSTAEAAVSTAELITVDYPTLLTDVAEGDRIVLGDGAISLHVHAVSAGAVHAVVLTGGRVQGRPGVHLPSERLRLTSPTEEDLELAVEMAAAGVDFLAVSFVREARDLVKLRTHVGDTCPRLIAKIETSRAVDGLDEILSATDAVMVARGDLGIECPLEDVPHLQKRIIRGCVEAGVPVITATQMMESMIMAPAPTRAEVSDIANAVFDGTDAVMLSAETAIGHDPALVVRTMGRVAARAEQEANYAQWGSRLGRIQRRYWADGGDRITLAITHAAWQAANDVGVAAILCCTRSGRTARVMARFRPLAQLVGLSPDEVTARSLALSWGVQPLVIDQYQTTDELVWYAVERAVTDGLAAHGDRVLVLAGAPDRGSAATDVLRIVTIE
jgi:pyruvate kinase